MSVNSINQSSSTTTDTGTKIVKAGEGMDKDAFLRILSAELSNQDPENASDGTQYVAQMAQFASLEQMANLNNSIRFSNCSSLIGKQVVLNSINDNGDLYSGTVKGVSRDGDSINLNVLVGQKKDSNGNMVDDIEEFSDSDVIEVKGAS